MRCARAFETRLGYKFGNEAEGIADNMDAPDYISDSVDEYMDEYWEHSIDDSVRLEHARRYGTNMIKIESEEEDEEEEEEVEQEDEARNPDDVQHERLLKILNTRNPRAIWELSDHPRGKEMLLRQGWQGSLDLKNKASMKRFRDYVSRVKK